MPANVRNARKVETPAGIPITRHWQIVVLERDYNSSLLTSVYCFTDRKVWEDEVRRLYMENGNRTDLAVFECPGRLTVNVVVEFKGNQSATAEQGTDASVGSKVSLLAT